jgi:hypothetical protein
MPDADGTASSNSARATRVTFPVGAEPLQDVVGKRSREGGLEEGLVRFQSNRPLDQAPMLALSTGIHVRTKREPPRLYAQLPGTQLILRCVRDLFEPVLAKTVAEAPHDPVADILDAIEDRIERFLQPFAPDAFARGIDEFHRHAHVAAELAHAAHQHGSHAEIARDVGRAGVPVEEATRLRGTDESPLPDSARAESQRKSRR